MWTWFLDKLKAHWPMIVLVLVCVGGGIAIGWGLKPDVVKIEEKLVEKEVVVKDGRIDELLTQLATLNRDYQEMKNSQTNERYHKEILETVNADGSKTVKTTIDKNVNTVVQETKKEVEIKVVEVEKKVVEIQTVTVTKDVVVEKVTTPVLAQWSVGLMVGVAPRFDNPSTTPIMVGVEAERRLVGPVWGGVWLMAGSPVTAFGVTNSAGGLKARIEF